MHYFYFIFFGVLAIFVIRLFSAIYTPSYYIVKAIVFLLMFYAIFFVPLFSKYVFIKFILHE